MEHGKQNLKKTTEEVCPFCKGTKRLFIGEDWETGCTKCDETGVKTLFSKNDISFLLHMLHGGSYKTFGNFTMGIDETEATKALNLGLVTENIKGTTEALRALESEGLRLALEKHFTKSDEPVTRSNEQQVETMNHQRILGDTFDNPWDALFDNPKDAEWLKIRSDLMCEISSYIRKQGWTQKRTAKICNVTQPRINELLTGKLSRFSLGSLAKIAINLGLKVTVKIEPLGLRTTVKTEPTVKPDEQSCPPSQP